MEKYLGYYEFDDGNILDFVLVDNKRIYAGYGGTGIGSRYKVDKDYIWNYDKSDSLEDNLNEFVAWLEENKKSLPLKDSKIQDGDFDKKNINSRRLKSIELDAKELYEDLDNICLYAKYIGFNNDDSYSYGKFMEEQIKVLIRKLERLNKISNIILEDIYNK